MTVKGGRKSTKKSLVKAKARKDPTIIMEDDGDLYVVDVEYPSYQTWRISNQSGEILRGCYYSDSKRSYVFLHRHESFDDIIATSQHESLHAAIEQCREWEFDEMADGKLLEKHMIRMDDNEEHAMIRVAMLPEFYFGE